ncbi:hypothetical protein KY290_030777 [Solanum tuberosum]|uniref:Uncharacterized protein n=1 Tax=Solanum tuberosum TaxID=4113 RepID=A0ABQ7U870_SOLTU|nr:hypothetical protein KY289_030013 [Solanum tuberosum]KAH0742784.1 hypothetical protein KY290_030777 [Solanum tuberosum]
MEHWFSLAQPGLVSPYGVVWFVNKLYRVTSLSSMPSELEDAIGFGPALLLLVVHHSILSRLLQKLQPDTERKFSYSDSFGCSMKTFKVGGLLELYNEFPAHWIQFSLV